MYGSLFIKRSCKFHSKQFTNKKVSHRETNSASPAELAVCHILISDLEGAENDCKHKKDSFTRRYNVFQNLKAKVQGTMLKEAFEVFGQE